MHVFRSGKVVPTKPLTLSSCKWHCRYTPVSYRTAPASGYIRTELPRPEDLHNVEGAVRSLCAVDLDKSLGPAVVTSVYSPEPACAACTFINGLGEPLCEMCGNLVRNLLVVSAAEWLDFCAVE